MWCQLLQRLFRVANTVLSPRVQDCQANYVACHNESYAAANKFDVVRFSKKGGTFFLNTKIASIDSPDKRIKELEKKISPKILRAL